MGPPTSGSATLRQRGALDTMAVFSRDFLSSLAA